MAAQALQAPRDCDIKGCVRLAAKCALRITPGYARSVSAAAALFFVLLWAQQSPHPDSFRFAILGDRTGEPQPGVYEDVWKDVAAEKPAFILSVGDTIQGMNDRSAEGQWHEIDRLLSPYQRVPLYLAPGNHDVWSSASERLFRQHARSLHYSVDYGPAHFTILDTSRTAELSTGELAFLEADLKAHAAQPLKFVISHRPDWLLKVALKNPNFGLHRLAKRYGVQYVIAGHIHQMLRFDLDGVSYISMPSSGGHLRSGAYDAGWFFGHALVEVDRQNVRFEIREVGPPHGQGRLTKLTDWGMAGLIEKHRPKSAEAR
jgi:predicted phosphodiesterase